MRTNLIYVDLTSTKTKLILTAIFLVFTVSFFMIGKYALPNCKECNLQTSTQYLPCESCPTCLIPSPCPPIMNIVICPIVINCSRIEGFYDGINGMNGNIFIVNKGYHFYDVYNFTNITIPLTTTQLLLDSTTVYSQNRSWTTTEPSLGKIQVETENNVFVKRV